MLRYAVRQYADEMDVIVKRNAKKQDAIVRSACVLKSGDVMTGSLVMGGH